MSTDDVHICFLALYERTYAKIAGFAARRARTPEDAADVVAETFLIAWRRFDQIPTGEAALYWLYATARFVLANEGRAEQRRSVTIERIASDLRRVLSQQEAAFEDERTSGGAAFAKLTNKERDVLLLAAWEGLDARGIGAVLGCSPTAARIRLHRSRHRLSELLGEQRASNAINRPTVETP